MPFSVTQTALPEVKLIEPKVYPDARGLFFECFQQRHFNEHVCADVQFVQDNQSRSHRGVLRGLHYQIEHAQGKLVRVVSGQIFDVAVDLRRRSPQFGQWVGVTLSAENRHQLWIPPGFAHGFMALSDDTEVIYKVSDDWHAEHERTLRWDDPDIGIEWPLPAPLQIADKDAAGSFLKDADVYA